jgi:hypothetical protein
MYDLARDAHRAHPAPVDALLDEVEEARVEREGSADVTRAQVAWPLMSDRGKASK